MAKSKYHLKKKGKGKAKYLRGKKRATMTLLKAMP